MSYSCTRLAFWMFAVAMFLSLRTVLPVFAHDYHNNPDGLHFSHPLIAESPSPDTKIRLDYFFLDVDGEVEDEELGEEGEGPSKFKESTVNLELEYAFTRNISIEADIPYTFINPDEGKDVNHFNNIEIGVKLATFFLEEYGILLGGGLEFGLPTGDDEKGIGSDNIFEIEPFMSFGWKYKILEVVSFLHIGFPVNQKGDQNEGDELGYNLSTLVHATEWLEVLLEFDGETVLNGEEEGESVLNIDPGVKFKPFKSQELHVGFGAGFPVTNDEEFEYRLIASVFYHFPYK
ncbi:MAG TPA: hypothetical protein VLG45_06215 [Thermodesulfobacteriota bacterium]|nr:hypothetical protein [Thermodesulfobacteriota bacterium]